MFVVVVVVVVAAEDVDVDGRFGGWGCGGITMVYVGRGNVVMMATEQRQPTALVPALVCRPRQGARGAGRSEGVWRTGGRGARAGGMS